MFERWVQSGANSSARLTVPASVKTSAAPTEASRKSTAKSAAKTGRKSTSADKTTIPHESVTCYKARSVVISTTSEKPIGVKAPVKTSIAETSVVGIMPSAIVIGVCHQPPHHPQLQYGQA